MTLDNSLVNPVTLHGKYKAATQKIEIYDTKTKEKTLVDSVKGLFLKGSTSATGWHNSKDTSIYSTESESKDEGITVMTDGGKTVIATGKWYDIKEKVTAVGGKYQRSVYLSTPEGILKMNLTGSALGPWFDFEGENRHRFTKNIIEVTAGTKKEKKGSVVYFPPIYNVLPEFTEEELERGRESYRDLAAYKKAQTDRALARKQQAVHDVNPLFDTPIVTPPTATYEDLPDIPEGMEEENSEVPF